MVRSHSAGASHSKDHAEVAFRPPWLLAAAIGLGFLLSWLKPAAFLPSEVTERMGALLFTAAWMLFVWAILAMRRHNASVPTSKPTHAVVQDGPYRFSRNPIYVAMILLLMSLAVLQNSAWFLGLAVIFGALLQFGVIRREESYLSGKFREEYEDYRRRVRRWV